MRSRREALGLSQSQVAAELGVTPSFLSHLESGKRQPTPEQVARLVNVLGLPSELIEIGSGRWPDDVPRIIENDAAEVVVAVRQRREATAVSYPTAPNVVPAPSKGSKQRIAARARSLPERIDATKGTTSYRAPSYHTKVPPAAITPFVSVRIS